MGNPYKAWKPIGIDTISQVRKNLSGSDTNGIINLRLELCGEVDEDDLVNGIAYQHYFS